MNLEPSKSERPLPAPSLSLENSELQKPFRSQLKKMEKFREKARAIGNRGVVDHWDEKILNLAEKIKTDKPDEKKVKGIQLKQLGKAVKKVRWLTNWIFKGAIHPSIALMNTKNLSKATPKEVMNSEVNAYLKTPLLKVDFADGEFVTAASINRAREKIDMSRLEVYNLLPDDLKNTMDMAAAASDPYWSDIQEKGKKVLETLQAGDPNKKIPFKDFKKAMLKQFPYKSSLLGDARVDFAKADQEFQKLLNETPKRAERMYFYTSTYDQLDGAVIYPKGRPEEPGKMWKNPTLIFVGGNSSFFESQVSEAQKLADKYGINVVVYNGPGVGFSMGKERGEEDVIDAFEGVYTAIQELVPNQDKIGVIGHSLGGGISAIGLGHLAKKGEVIKEEQKPGLYINYHSFSSLSRVVANAHAGSDWILRQFIKMLGFGNMNAARALQKRSIAKKVVIVSADQDKIIKRDGQLAKDVERLINEGKDFSKNKIVSVASKALDEEEYGKDVGLVAHNDLGGLTEEGAIADYIREWADRAK